MRDPGQDIRICLALCLSLLSPILSSSVDVMKINESHEMVLESADRIDLSNKVYEPLFPHQVDAMQAFRSFVVGTKLDQYKAEDEGGSILLPPGSGKTTIAGAMTLGLKSGSEGNIRALQLVPNKNILRDTVATLHRHFPDMRVRTGSKHSGDYDTWVTTYQSLEGLMSKDRLSAGDHRLLIADEHHHIIDGEWAKRVRDLSVGAIAVGTCASPAYDAVRNVREIFPHVLTRKSFAEGQAEGFVGDFVSHFIETKGRGASTSNTFERRYLAEDVHRALAIVAEHAKNGKRGVIMTPAGSNRAVSRVIEELASTIDINGRPLQIKHIDGSMVDEEVEEVRRQLRNGEIDGITNVGMLGEGADLREIDWMMILRGTRSQVLSLQRLGRATRRGKVTDVYEFRNPKDLDIVTHRDAFALEFTNLLRVKDGDTEYADRTSVSDYLPSMSRSRSSDTMTEKQLRKYDQLNDAVESMEFSAGVAIETDTRDFKSKYKKQKLITSLGQLEIQLGMSRERIVQILEKTGNTYVVTDFGDYKREFIGQEAFDSLLSELDIVEAGETDVSLQRIFSIARRQVQSVGSRGEFMAHIAKEADVHPVPCVSNGSISLFVSEDDIEKISHLFSTEVAEVSFTNMFAKQAEAKRKVASTHESNGSDTRAAVPKQRSDTEVLSDYAQPVSTQEKGLQDLLLKISRVNELRSNLEREDIARRTGVLMESLRGYKKSPGGSTIDSFNTVLREGKLVGPDGFVSAQLGSISRRHGVGEAAVLASLVKALKN